MFLASVGQDSELEVFAYYLADRLGKTQEEIGAMPAAEYAAWAAYHKVKQSQEDLAIRAARNGR